MHFCLLIISLLAFNHSLSAQKLIKIDQDLKAHSESLEIKTKTIPIFSVLFKGALSDGTIIIDIKPVFEGEDGKEFKFYQAMKQPRGYEFFLDGQSIGAVQVLPLKQRFLWIRDGLDEEMKGVVATAAVSILLKGILGGS